MTTNNRISNIVSSQVPFFVRSDHENFVKFLEAYYEYLEQTGKAVDRTKNLTTYFDIDRTVDEFTDELYNTFINLIPDETVADKSIILKNAKDLYRAKGTEKSIQFLLRIVFGTELLEPTFYYPKTDILRASDGKWFIEKSLKVSDIKVNGVANTVESTVQNFVGRRVRGNTSGATAIIERVDSYYDTGTFVRELKLSNQTKDFSSNEELFALFEENGVTKSITANTFSGIITSVKIDTAGSGYQVGDQVRIESNTGNGGLIVVSSVTTGNIRSLRVISGGAGFQVNNSITISGSLGGSGATANVLTVLDDSSVHPNSYNLLASIINLEANTAIGNATYSNLVNTVVDPANNWVSNSMVYFTYANTGPIKSVLLLSSGDGYSGDITFGVSSNDLVKKLGILGRMEIISGGFGYNVGDVITFTNVPGGVGVGANARVASVNVVSNSITRVEFCESTDSDIIGGQGYSQEYLPIANVVSSNTAAYGANIAVTAVLGFGFDLQAESTTLGAIRELRIISGGVGYETAPTLNLESIGSGTGAKANATVVTGVYTYPGRYLNDDGFISGSNYLENRDYYQPFSYVVRTNRSIEKYRKYLKDLLHPAGLKLFGEYLTTDDSPNNNISFQSAFGATRRLVSGTYSANGNGNSTYISVFTNRNLTGIVNAIIEYVSVDPVYSNLYFIASPATVGQNTTSGNLYTSSAFGQSSNLQARVDSGNPTRIELVSYKTVNNTSNLLINSIDGSDEVSLVNYTPIGLMSNLEAKTTTNGNLISLVQYTEVGSLSNIQAATGTGSTNTINLVQYTLVNNISSLRVNTAAGGSTNTLSLITLEVPNNITSNLRVNTGSEVSNSISLIKFENAQALTNLAVSTDAVEVTNQLNLLRFIEVSNQSNLLISTTQADQTDRIVLQRFVDSLGAVSNIQVRTGFAVPGTNTTQEISFVQYTPIFNTANIQAFTPNTPTIVPVNYSANLTVNTGTSQTNTVRLISFKLVQNTSNLLYTTSDAYPNTNTTNVITFNRRIAESNVPFGVDYYLNVNGSNVFIVSSNTNTNTVIVSSLVEANLDSYPTIVYERKYAPANVRDANVYFSNGYSVIINGIAYRISSLSPSGNTITLSSNVAANTFNASMRFISQNSNGKSIVITFSKFLNINGTSNIRANVFNAFSNTIVFTRPIGSSNVFFGQGYTINIANAYTVVVTNSSPTSNTITVTPTINKELRSSLVRVISVSRPEQIANSNIAFGAGYKITVNNISVNVMSVDATSNSVVVDYEYPLNLSNLSFRVDSFYKDVTPLQSNVPLDISQYTYKVTVNGQNTAAIISVNANSNSALMMHPIRANLTNASLSVNGYYASALPKTSNVSFDTGYTVNIAGNNYVLSGVDSNTSTVTLRTQIPGRIVGNTMTIVSYYEPAFLRTSNVFFSNTYRIILDGTTFTVLDSNPFSDKITVSPSLAGNYTSNVLTVGAYYKDQWTGNSNVTIKPGYRLNISGSTYTVTSLNYQNNVINITPAISSGLFNTALVIERYYRDEWAQNSNVAFANGYTLNIGGANTVTITGYNALSNTITVTPALPGGLFSNSLNIISYYKPVSANISNTIFNVGYTLNIGRGNTVVVTGISGNRINVTPALSGGKVNASINVVSYYKDQWLVNSNVSLFTVVSNTSNLTANSDVSGTIITLSQWKANSNVFFGTGNTVTIGGVNTVILSSSPKSNTILVSPSVGAYVNSNTITISSLSGGNNYLLRINGFDVIGTSIGPNSNLLRVTTNIGSNLVNSTINVVAKYIDAWLSNSNVAFSSGYRINVGGLGIFNVVSADAQSSTIRLSPASGLIANSLNNKIVVEYYYQNQWLANSNTAFGNNYVLRVNGQNVTVLSSGNTSSILSVFPALQYSEVNASINLISYYVPAWVQNSNGYFTTGDNIQIGKVNVTITSSVANSSAITFTPSIAGNTVNTIIVHRPVELSNGTFNVTANSACTNGYFYIVDGQSINANGSLYTSV